MNNTQKHWQAIQLADAMDPFTLKEALRRATTPFEYVHKTESRRLGQEEKTAKFISFHHFTVALILVTPNDSVCSEVHTLLSPSTKKFLGPIGFVRLIFKKSPKKGDYARDISTLCGKVVISAGNIL